MVREQANDIRTRNSLLAVREEHERIDHFVVGLCRFLLVVRRGPSDCGGSGDQAFLVVHVVFAELDEANDFPRKLRKSRSVRCPGLLIKARRNGICIAIAAAQILPAKAASIHGGPGRGANMLQSLAEGRGWGRRQLSEYLLGFGIESRAASVQANGREHDGHTLRENWTGAGQHSLEASSGFGHTERRLDRHSARSGIRR